MFQPNSAVDLACAGLIWIPVIIGVLSFVGWAIQGEIEPIVGIAGVIIALTLGGLAIVPNTRHLAPFLLASALGAMILIPMARAQHEKMELAKIDVGRVEKAYDLLRKDRNNVEAKMRIAKVLYKRGYTAQAITLASNALDKAPRALYEEELRMLRQWQVHPIAQPVPGLTCVECGAKNKAGEVFCGKCRAPILLHYARGSWVAPNAFRRMLMIWVAGGLSIVGIPLAQSRMLPNKSRVVVVLLLSCSALIVWLALRKGKGDSSFEA
ncbi:MAG TPA: zinc ribbon domain-containing protein [Fimbriimonadaceae bacterium]|jgi:hypothetical protein